MILRDAIRVDRAANAVFYVSDAFHASIDAVEAWAANPADAAGQNSRELAQRLSHKAIAGDGWTFAQYCTLAGWRTAMLEGDAQGAARVAEMRQAVAPALAAPVSAKRKVVRGAQGDYVDPHKVLMGNLGKAWTARKRAIGRAPAPVSILIPTTSNADAGSDSFFWRAAAGIALAVPMQRAGYRVTIVQCDTVANSYITASAPRYTFVAHVIARGVTVDVPRVTAAVGAASLRFLTFAVIGAAPGLHCESGLGQAVDAPDTITRLALASGAVRAGDDVLLVPSDIRSQDSARKWLARTSQAYAPAAA